MEYEFQTCTRHCHTTGKEFVPGEEYFSALIEEGIELKRFDFSATSWQGPPENAIGWWKSQLPGKTSKKKHWAPNDVMLQFFDELQPQSDKQDFLYVLTLLLVRRRVFRIEEEEKKNDGQESITVYCPRRETSYTMSAVMPSQARVEEIQKEIAALLL